MKTGIKLAGALAIATIPGAAFAARPAAPATAASHAPHGDTGCLPRASDGVGEVDPIASRAAGVKIMAELIEEPGQQPVASPSAEGRVAADLGQLAVDGAFGNLWARCGLTRRERSLVTLGILTALRANSELEYHFRIAKRNGLSRREIEEAIYQASGYAGFPAAANASIVYGKVLAADIEGK